MTQTQSFYYTLCIFVPDNSAAF